jgi:hypothetical protein
MEIVLTFKTPDVVFNALEEEALCEEERADFEAIISKWVKYGETVRLCVNTDSEEVVVMDA